MASIFLHGGGDDPAWREQTFGRFAAATQALPQRPIALLIVEDDDAEYENTVEAYHIIFKSLGVPAEHLAPLRISYNEPLSRAMLEQLQPSGVLVSGGSTPQYNGALNRNTAWLGWLHDARVPYFGTSAGAAIAAQHAILGGWQAQRDGAARPMLYMGAGEGLTELTIQPGLGLVPFAVDVHASQWGTLLRLIHAVNLKRVPFGWAIDEDTLLEYDGHTLQLYGKGHAYLVRPLPDGGAAVMVYVAGYKEYVAAAPMSRNR